MTRKIFSLVAVFFIVIFGLWLGYQKLLSLNQFLPAPLQSFFSQTNFKFKTHLADFIDAFYPKTYLQFQARKKLDQLELIMSSADINNLKASVLKANQLGYHDKETASKQQITLVYNQTQLPAQISIHGGGVSDYIYFKTDYSLKLLDNQFINQADSFNLLNPQVHGWILPLLTNQVAQSLNLYYNQQKPVSVKINNKNYGLHLLEEKINQQFLANRNLEQAQVIKLKDETRLVHWYQPVGLNAHHLSGFDFEIANIDLDNYDPVILFQINQFFKAIKNQDLAVIAQYINLDYLARYDAYREFLGIDHDVSGDNLIFFYSSADNKFYPIVRNENDLNQLIIEDGTTLKSYNQYDSHLETQLEYPRLFLLLHRLPQFRVLKYQYLNQLVSQYPQLQQEFQSIYNQYSDLFVYDTTDESSIRYKQKLFNSYLKTIDHNFNLIKQQLNFAQVAINVINDSSQTTIEIVPDSVMPVVFDQFLLEFNSGHQLMDITDKINQTIILADFGEHYNLIPTTYSFAFIVPSPVVSVTVKAKNKITNQPIESIHTAIATKP